MELDNTIVLGVGPSLADHEGLAWIERWTAAALNEGRDVLLVIAASPRAEAALTAVAAGMAGTGDAAPRARLHGLGPIEQAERVRQRVSHLAATRLLDPNRVGPVTRGAPLAATPRRLHTRELLASTIGARIAVIAGGVGVDDSGEPTWMGEDGTAVTAGFIAGSLGLPLKLAGMEGRTPRRAGLLARRFGVEVVHADEEAATVSVSLGSSRRAEGLAFGLTA